MFAIFKPLLTFGSPLLSSAGAVLTDTSVYSDVPSLMETAPPSWRALMIYELVLFNSFGALARSA
jgi:hypothetical protein